MEQQKPTFLVLAALLHDIGKFAQRAGRPKSKELEGEYCPFKNSHFSHAHVLYTDYCITNDLPLPEELDGHKHALARLAAVHHKPGESVLAEKTICIADRLSAGSDRANAVEETEKADYKSARMLSVFSQIDPCGKGEVSRAHYRLAPIDEDPFPAGLETARKDSYDNLYERFLEDAQQLPKDMGVRHYIDSLVSLLELHTWCVPSSTYKTEADISLFDHSITTAAISQALTAYHEVEGGLPGEGSQRLRKFLLIGGDLSGIQSYIFNVASSHGTGVAKLFRARSFELQALTLSVILSLCDRLGLTPLARIIDAGGRFTLLLPNTAIVREELDRFEIETQQWFFRRFKGRLSLSLSWDVELRECDFERESFRFKLDELQDSLDRRKLHKFHRLFSQGARPVHDWDQELFARSGVCPVCEINPVDEEATASFQEKQKLDKPVPICRDCSNQIANIGRLLAHDDTKYLVLERGGSGVELFDGIRMRLEKSVGRAERDALHIVNLRDRGSYAYHAVAGHLPKFTEKDIQDWQAQGREAMLSIDEQGIKAGEPKTFQMLGIESVIADADGLRGKPFLGAFKADVDNLGLLFGIGLGDKLSISRFAGLSRMLNHFFADYLVKVIREECPNIYVVFAGGDDLFLLGPWTEIVTFASRVDKDFRRYVADNGQVTLSAGVAVCRPLLPMQSVAKLAEKLLEESKQCGKDSADQKNAVTLFDVTVPWTEFNALLRKGDWLEHLVLDKLITMGLVSRLLRYAEDHKAFLAGEFKKGLYRSHMAYDFARNIKKDSLDTKDRDELFGLKTDLGLLEKLRLPVSYALYRLRKE